jgi:small subunit ribosomal protein S1
MSESFAALFEESLQRTEMRPGEVITAEVVRVEHNFVVVNAGLKSEAYIPSRNSRTTRANRSPGRRLRAGGHRLHRKRLRRHHPRATPPSAWPPGWRKALESGEFVTGTTSGKVKGGLTVLVNGIRAFLPGSLVDTRPVKDLTPYENKTWNSRSSSSTASATTWCCRAAPWSKPPWAKSAPS